MGGDIPTEETLALMRTSDPPGALSGGHPHRALDQAGNVLSNQALGCGGRPGYGQAPGAGRRVVSPVPELRASRQGTGHAPTALEAALTSPA